MEAEASGVSLIGTLDTFGGMGAPVLEDDYALLKSELLERLVAVAIALMRSTCRSTAP